MFLKEYTQYLGGCLTTAETEFKEYSKKLEYLMNYWDSSQNQDICIWDLTLTPQRKLGRDFTWSLKTFLIKKRLAKNGKNCSQSTFLLWHRMLGSDCERLVDAPIDYWRVIFPQNEDTFPTPRLSKSMWTMLLCFFFLKVNYESEERSTENDCTNL